MQRIPTLLLCSFFCFVFFLGNFHIWKGTRTRGDGSDVGGSSLWKCFGVHFHKKEGCIFFIPPAHKACGPSVGPLSQHTRRVRESRHKSGTCATRSFLKTESNNFHENIWVPLWLLAAFGPCLLSVDADDAAAAYFSDFFCAPKPVCPLFNLFCPTVPPPRRGPGGLDSLSLTGCGFSVLPPTCCLSLPRSLFSFFFFFFFPVSTTPPFAFLLFFVFILMSEAVKPPPSPFPLPPFPLSLPRLTTTGASEEGTKPGKRLRLHNTAT